MTNGAGEWFDSWMSDTWNLHLEAVNGLSWISRSSSSSGCIANIYFNRQCLKKRLTSNYAKLKIRSGSPAAKHMLRKAQTMRIKDELRFLHIKKQKLNHQLFKLHLSLANTWGKSWSYIQEVIEGTLQKTMRPKYKTLDSKLPKLTQQ